MMLVKDYVCIGTLVYSCHIHIDGDGDGELIDRTFDMQLSYCAYLKL
jgi:hypothetical protein